MQMYQALCTRQYSEKDAKVVAEISDLIITVVVKILWNALQ